MPQEESTFLLPDAVEIVDLPALTSRHIGLPGTPAVAAMAWDFGSMVVTRVDVVGAQNTADGWRLQRRGLFGLNLRTREVSSETPWPRRPGPTCREFGRMVTPATSSLFHPARGYPLTLGNGGDRAWPACTRTAVSRCCPGR